MKPALFFGAVIAAVGGLFLWGRATPHSRPTESPSTPPRPLGKGLPEDTVRDRLLLIGRRLQIYRHEKGFLPVGKRRSAKDAGLPSDLLELAQPGHPWSLPHGRADFRFDLPVYNHIYDPPNPSHFMSVYAERTPGADPSTWAKYGEKRPILMCELIVDEAIYRDVWAVGYPVLVLRLNGEVARVQRNPRNPADILSR